MKKSLLVSLLTFAVALGMSAQTEPQKSPSMGKSSAATKTDNANAKPIDQSNFDTSVKPSDDFFLYANGGWIKRTEIPPDKATISVFSILADTSDKQTADLIEEVAKSSAPAGSGKRKIADLYNSFMDEAAVESKGLSPIKPHLDAIA